MRVIQISDLHLGPLDEPEPVYAEANAVAWGNAAFLAKQLRTMAAERGDDELVIVITGDLTDDGHTFPHEFDAVNDWLKTLPGVVLCVPGNHDVGNFTASASRPKVSEQRVGEWERRVGPDRFSHARDGHRLLGLDAMVLGSGLPREAEQDAWLARQLDEAQRAGQRVWVFQHPPMFLRSPDEVRTDRETYWCPPPEARDRVLQLLDQPHVMGVLSGHVHRCFDHPRPRKLQPATSGGMGIQFRWCPALSGTHTEGDYFPPHEEASRHALSVLDLDGDRMDVTWVESGLKTRTRWVG